MPVTLDKIVHNPKDQFRRGWIPGKHRGLDNGWDEDYLAESLKQFVGADGKVLSVYKGGRYNGGWGNRIIIAVTDRAKIAYAHFRNGELDDRRVGEILRAGFNLGKMGSTGAATGDHQHFEIYIDGERVNPAPYLAGKPLPGNPIVKPAAGTPAGSVKGHKDFTVRNKLNVHNTINGRLNPTTKAGVAQKLRGGITGTFDAYMKGEKVTQNGVTSDVWIRGAFNHNWFWLGNFTNRSVSGLKNLGTFKAPVTTRWADFSTGNNWYYYDSEADARAHRNPKKWVPRLKHRVDGGQGPFKIWIGAWGKHVWVGDGRSNPRVTLK